MSEHKLPPGKRLIAGLTALGEALGYHVQQEFPVDRKRTRNSPAVDLAWFMEAGQPFPLFIFEAGQC